jgi:hypothetical protein
MNYIAIVAAALVAFIISAVYYSAFAKSLATLSAAYANSTSMPPWKIGIELGRNVVLASVIACIAWMSGKDTWTDGVALGALLWLGFPVVLWTGAVIWEKVPLKLAAIHSGDWLLKLIIVSVIVSLF